MANILSSVGGGVQNFLYSGLGNILSVVVILLAVILFFGIVFLFFWYKSYDVKVNIYQPVGQVPMSEDDVIRLKKIKDSEERLKKIKSSGVRFDYLRRKKTHGKHTKVKGVQHFQTFMPMRKLPPVPLTLMYDDGVHLVQLSRDILIPIPKPNMSLVVGKNVSLSVEEDIQWKTWNNMMADRINNKYQDLDAQRKIAFYFIVGIVGLVLIGGFLLWLIYNMARRDLTVNFDERLVKLISGEAPS